MQLVTAKNCGERSGREEGRKGNVGYDTGRTCRLLFLFFFIFIFIKDGQTADEDEDEEKEEEDFPCLPHPLC